MILGSLTDVTYVVSPGGDHAHGVFSGRFFGQADQFHVVIDFNVSFQLDQH